MRISTIKLFLKDALKSLKRNTTLSIASIATVMATLFILGAFLLTVINVKVGINGVESQLQVKVFLKDDIKIDQQQKIYDKLNELSGKTSITFESKAQALQNLKKQLGDKNKDLLDGMESSNNLPNSYIVKAKTADDIPKISASVKGMPGIDQINDGSDAAKKLSVIVKTIQWVGIVLFSILIGVSLFLIANTIRLAVYARRREIGIMKYIGATDWFIRWPFVFEGMIIGLFGAVASVIVLYYLYTFAYSKVKVSTLTMMMNFLPPSYVLTSISWEFIVLGMIIGALGSIFAIRKFLVV